MGQIEIKARTKRREVWSKCAIRWTWYNEAYITVTPWHNGIKYVVGKDRMYNSTSTWYHA